ncbi:hypothetical protein ACFVW9_26515 [Streptomyces sp. NPDC058217]|uniref:hypothetical protein n=1 Tax=Streptomyces sp. NPDC058217 TaxID=3346384 RepID=UPI0036EB9BEF
MTPGTERALVISSVTANVLAVVGALASAADKLPDAFLPIAVLIFGCTGLYLVHRFVMAGSRGAAKGTTLTTTLVLTLLVAYWASNHAWPDQFPLGRQRNAAVASSETRKPTAGASHASLTRGLKVSEPRKLSRIGTCTAVVGSGQIPKGHQIWVANLNDQGGAANTTGLFNLRRATQIDGDDQWKTDPFGVGGDLAAGKNFWIYVYLLPESAGSVVENLISPKSDEGWRPSLSAPIAGLAPFDEIPVQRTGENTCGGS